MCRNINNRQLRRTTTKNISRRKTTSNIRSRKIIYDWTSQTGALVVKKRKRNICIIIRLSILKLIRTKINLTY